MSLELVPVSFVDACEFVGALHRHHRPPVGHKFSIGAADGDTLVGVVMVGRPVARPYDNGQTLEVTRSCTDGTAHVNSMLYGAAWRAAKALGYRRLITYTQDGESGSSLRGADHAAERGVPYLATVRSVTGPWHHCTVARHGEVIHDPSGRLDAYRSAAILGAEVLVTTYEPGPDELVRQWEATS